MQLRPFFGADGVDLDLQVTTRNHALAAMVRLLHVDSPTATVLETLLERRETLGSTGVGRGIAIPHCRAPIIPALRLAFGRVAAGLSYGAIDGQPVHFLFLIVAPPTEASNEYLPVLGRLAQFAKDPDIPQLLSNLKTPSEFFQLLDTRGA